MNKYKAVSGVAWGVLLGCIGQANAFQLSPDGTLAEREMAKKYGVTYKATVPFASFALHNFSDPAHEALTQKIYGCDGDWQDCSNPNLENAGAYVIAGVRWNDDPVFMPGAEDAKTKGNLSHQYLFERHPDRRLGTAFQ